MKLALAVTSNPPENLRVSSNALLKEASMKPMIDSVKMTSENMARVIPVRKRLAIGYASAVRMMGASVRPRPPRADIALTRYPELYITTHTAPTTSVMPERMNSSIPSLNWGNPKSSQSMGMSQSSTRTTPAAVYAMRSGRCAAWLSTSGTPTTTSDRPMENTPNCSDEMPFSVNRMPSATMR